MEKLISEREIIELGYKPETRSSYLKKPNNRFIFCSHCGSWTNTTRQPDKKNNTISDICFWCECNFKIEVSPIKQGREK